MVKVFKIKAFILRMKVSLPIARVSVPLNHSSSFFEF
jgi:hypothetical protein